jgi:hypothetical protein
LSRQTTKTAKGVMVMMSRELGDGTLPCPPSVSVAVSAMFSPLPPLAWHLTGVKFGRLLFSVWPSDS